MAKKILTYMWTEFMSADDCRIDCIDWHPTGSNYICDPPVTNTDIDYVILVSDLESAQFKLINKGFKLCGQEDGYQINDFWAFRKESLNYILTDNRLFFDKFCAATELAKHRNLTYKPDRIELFQRILYHKEKQCLSTVM